MIPQESLNKAFLFGGGYSHDVWMMFQPPHPCCEKVELVPGGHDLEVTEENKAVAPEVDEFPWIFQ